MAVKLKRLVSKILSSKQIWHIMLLSIFRKITMTMLLLIVMWMNMLHVYYMICANKKKHLKNCILNTYHYWQWHHHDDNDRQPVSQSDFIRSAHYLFTSPLLTHSIKHSAMQSGLFSHLSPGLTLRAKNIECQIHKSTSFRRVLSIIAGVCILSSCKIKRMIKFH